MIMNRIGSDVKIFEVLIFTVNLDRPNQSQLISPKEPESGNVVHERRSMVELLGDGWEPISIAESPGRSYGYKWVFKRVMT